MLETCVCEEVGPGMRVEPLENAGAKSRAVTLSSQAWLQNSAGDPFFVIHRRRIYDVILDLWPSFDKCQPLVCKIVIQKFSH